MSSIFRLRRFGFRISRTRVSHIHASPVRVSRGGMFPVRASHVRASRAFVSHVRRCLAITVLLLVPCLLFSCAPSSAADPFTLVRGDFDAEITWELPKKDSGTSSLRDPATYTATVRFRDGLLAMAFTSPESMAGIEVTETSRGTVTARRGGKQLEGTAFGQYLTAARLLTETGVISGRVSEPDGTSLTYLVTLRDGTKRTRTMSLDGDLRPRFVTDPGYATIRVVWFEPSEK